MPSHAYRRDDTRVWLARGSGSGCLVLRFRAAPRRASDAAELTQWLRVLEPSECDHGEEVAEEAHEMRIATTLHDLRHLFTLMRWAATGDDSSKRASREVLLDALSDAERVCERGLAGATPEQVDLVEITALVRKASAAATRAARTNPTASVDVDAGPEILIATDASALGRLLRNVLINAIECSRESGRVLVRCERDADGGVRIAVRDEGPGTLRLPSTGTARARRVGARGIGLTSVLHSAAELGAQLTVDRDFGRGSTVIIRLPPTRARSTVVLAPPCTMRDEVEAELRARREHVLAINDAADALRALRASDQHTLIVSPAAVARDARGLWEEAKRRRAPVRLHHAAARA